MSLLDLTTPLWRSGGKYTAEAGIAYRTRCIIRILVEQHVNVNVVDIDGNTPSVLLLNAELTVGELSCLLFACDADPALISPTVESRPSSE